MYTTTLVANNDDDDGADKIVAVTIRPIAFYWVEDDVVCAVYFGENKGLPVAASAEQILFMNDIPDSGTMRLDNGGEVIETRKYDGHDELRTSLKELVNMCE